MSGMDIFEHETSLIFAAPKLASVQLDEDPKSWTRQVLTELYRVVPEVSDYTPEVMFVKTDEEQGYALGVIVVTNATDSALSATRIGGSARKALIPVIVKNHMLMPMDLLMSKTGKMTPLNAHRLREALFRPETFEMITEDWGDTTLYNMFYPPGRSDNSFGAGTSQGMDGGGTTFVQGPGMKMSSLRFEMLEAMLPTILPTDIEVLAGRLEAVPGLMKAASKNPATMAALHLLTSADGMETKSAAELQDLALSTAPQHVVQMGCSDGAYWVKSASRSAYGGPTVQQMSRGEFLKFAGPEATAKVDTEGTVTLSQGVGGADPDLSAWGPVDRPGIYKVRTVHGKELTGWVIPSLLDFDGSRAPMAVFTNGAAAMVQDQIVGAQIATGVDLPASSPKGSGVFYVAGQGGIEATVPLVVIGKEAGMDGGDSYLVRSLTGEDGRVRIVNGVRGMQALGGDIVVPPTAKFLALETEIATPLVGRVDELDKTASTQAAPHISVFSSFGVYNMQYHNLPKLASVSSRELEIDDAVLVLCAAGLDAQAAHDKLAAAENHSINIFGLTDVRLAQDLINTTRKVASARSARVMALRHDLVKEAAVLPSSMTVDAVLSLGFINSENVRMYISRLPYLDQCLSMLCELLLASRLGLNEVPEFAAARGVRALDEVVQGLRALSLRDPDSEATASP